MASKFFHAGGSISSKADCYIVRGFEKDVLQYQILALPEQRQYISVLGSRQVGKTSFLYRIQTYLRQKKVPSVIIDISGLRQLEGATWYNHLALELHRRFKENQPYHDKSVHDALSFISFLDHLEVVAGPKNWGIIMFDETATVPADLRDSFFSNLRRLYNYRLDSDATPATRFVFIFAGSFYPDKLISDKNNSPFNVSYEVEVKDFTRQEVNELLLRGAGVLGVHFEKKATDEIWEAARGHPFLTQKICQDLVLRSKTAFGLADVRAVVNRIVNNTNDTHLSSIVRYLKECPPYTDLLRKVVLSHEEVSMYRVDTTGVERIGVLVADEKYPGIACVRNKIYERYLFAYLKDVSLPREDSASRQKKTQQEQATGKQTKAIKIFYSYEGKDEVLRAELEKHLSSLQREGLISGWNNRKIVAGQDRAVEIDERLNSAHVILLLVSPDFLASEYCFESEVMRIMERYERGEAIVIPIILRPVDWQVAPFGKLQSLPTNAQAVTMWQDQDAAFLDVARGIRKVVKELLANRLVS